MIRLFIENKELDTTEGFSHQITYAVDDLNNLDSKSTNFSKTIVLPGTAKNNYLLGNIFEFANSNFTGEGPNVGYNFNASKSAKCRLDSDGLTIIKGVLRLMEIIRDGEHVEYEVAIFGELGGFFSKLQNKKLTDLDFSAYNHIYNLTTIDNYWSDTSEYAFTTGTDTTLFNGTPTFIDIYENVSDYIEIGDIIQPIRLSNGVSYGDRIVTLIEWDGTKTHIEVSANWAVTPTTSFSCKIIVTNKKGFGIYYPLIDYGNYSINKHDYNIRTFRPALHVYEYIDKIIKGAGYTWESKFFKTDFFKRLIIPFNQKDLYKKSITDYIINTSSIPITASNTVPTEYDNKKQEFSGLTLNDFTYSSGDFTYTGTETINVKIKFNYFYIHNHGNIGNLYGASSCQIRKNGSIIQNPNETYATKNNIITNEYLYDEIIAITSLVPGDVISFEILTFSANSFSTTTLDDRSKISLNIDPPAYMPYSINNIINMADVIPENILQKDFFASILKMFYLMVTEDKYKDRHLIIEPWTWFYNLNKNSYLDWSMKLDRSQPIKIKPMSEANARYYDIKYKSDTDYYNDFYKKKFNQGYGDIRFDNELEFAKDAETTEVIFSSTPLLGYQGEDKITPAIFKWDGKIIGDKEENINSNIRIMQKKGITTVDEWSVLDSSGGILASYTKYPYAGHFDDPDVPGSDLNFGATKELFFSLLAGALGNNLFNTFYSSYLAEITDKDSRLVTAKFKLNDTDIFNLDFGRFIWLDGVLYRLQKVIDYTPGEICTVELLRIIYTTYDNSVNSADNPEVIINGKTWQTKNFDGEFYANGDPIPQITDDTEWASTTEGAWCYYENVTTNGIEYGKLYNWYAVNDARGLLTGYHVPTDTELSSLFALDSNGNTWKEIGTTHWNTANGTDVYGFKAVGTGRRRYSSAFDELKDKNYLWTSTEYDVDKAYYYNLNDSSSSINTDKEYKNSGFSVRLVKD